MQFYGRRRDFQVDVDFSRKAGPLTRVHQGVVEETSRLENGGKGLPGEGAATPPEPAPEAPSGRPAAPTAPPGDDAPPPPPAAPPPTNPDTLEPQLDVPPPDAAPGDGE
jgi:general secretion pathway protein D